MLHKSIVDVCKENQGCVPTIVKHNLNSGKCLWGKKKRFQGRFCSERRILVWLRPYIYLITLESIFGMHMCFLRLSISWMKAFVLLFVVCSFLLRSFKSLLGPFRWWEEVMYSFTCFLPVLCNISLVYCGIHICSVNHKSCDLIWGINVYFFGFMMVPAISALIYRSHVVLHLHTWRPCFHTTVSFWTNISLLHKSQSLWTTTHICSSSKVYFSSYLQTWTFLSLHLSLFNKWSTNHCGKSAL